MEKLKFWLKYKTVKAKNNMCNDCCLFKLPCEQIVKVSEGGCNKKNFQLRDWNQIVQHIIIMAIVLIVTLSFVLGGLMLGGLL
jgi:hypothetical protein